MSAKQHGKHATIIKPNWSASALIKYALDQAIESEQALLDAHARCTGDEDEHLKAEMRGRLLEMRRYRERRFGQPPVLPHSGMSAGAIRLTPSTRSAGARGG